jgi:hypothetical protein
VAGGAGCWVFLVVCAGVPSTMTIIIDNDDDDDDDSDYYDEF